MPAAPPSGIGFTVTVAMPKCSDRFFSFIRQISPAILSFFMMHHPDGRYRFDSRLLKFTILREPLQTCSYHPRNNKQHEHAGGHENGDYNRAEREAPRRGNGVGIAAGGIPRLT